MSSSTNTDGKDVSAGQVKNVREALDSIVRTLHLLNGGGAVALLAFLGTTWNQEPDLRKPILIVLSILAAGEAIVGLSTYLRVQWLIQMLGSPTRDYAPPRYYRITLVAAFLCFIVAMAILIIWLFWITANGGVQIIV